MIMGCSKSVEESSLINDEFFFTNSKHWKVKDLYYTSSEENMEKLRSSLDNIYPSNTIDRINGETYLDDDTLQLIKNYNFYETPEDNMFTGMKIKFSEELLEIIIDGYDTDNGLKLPYRIRKGKIEVDFGIISPSDDRFNKIKMNISKNG